MSAPKSGLRPHNRHNGRHDLAILCQVTPGLTRFLTLTPDGGQGADFVNPQAVEALNKALSARSHAAKNWGIPNGFSCSSVSGRADYVHHLADLLGETSGIVPTNASVLDVGVGANCIYPLIGVHEYGWRSAGSETSSEALNGAQAIVNASPGLAHIIRPRRQKDVTAISDGIIRRNGQYEATLCNPPFHNSAASARARSERERRDLGQDKDDALNFDGQQQELWCEGGEVAFIRKMIVGNQALGRQVMWFTTLMSRGESLPPLHHTLTDAGAMKVVRKEMAQGQEQSRSIVQTLVDNDQRHRFMAYKR